VADCEEGEQGRHEVGAGVERLGQQPQAVGGEAGGELERDERGSGHDRSERGSPPGAHGPKATPGASRRKTRANGDALLWFPRGPSALTPRFERSSEIVTRVRRDCDDLDARRGQRQRFPRSACSRSIASNSALKFPSPKLVAPWRSITSKNTVGRSWAVFVKI